jgi:hypothetical protein
MKQYALISLVVIALLISGCQTLGNKNQGEDVTGKIVLDDEDFVFLDEPVLEEQPGTEEKTEVPEKLDPVDDIKEEDVAYVIKVTEGDLVKLDLQAVDPDGDKLEYAFSNPLNEQGRWQTKIGDEGKYLTTVTVSDGKLATSEDILIVIVRANRPPFIECPEQLIVKENELLTIDCNVYDEEGDSILISYEGWVSSNTKQTNYNDAGKYTALIRASDSKKESTKTLEIVVENVNRAPTLDSIDDLTVMETTNIAIKPKTSDPDGDEVVLSYSKPLNDNGEWLTNDGDSGVYDVIVVASDGSATATEKFVITVTQINTVPVLKEIKDITVNEGETIKIPVNAYDPEGDELTISYSGYMDRAEKAVGYEESGSYEQTVTVSDGVLQTSQTFTITIVNKNRAPKFVLPAGE